MSAQVLAVWRLRMLLLAAPCAFLFAFLFARFGGNWILALSCATLALLFILLYFLYYPIKYRKLSYTAGTDYFIIRSGVFFNRVKALPYTSIQYTSLAYTPVSGWFGLRTLMIFLAGTSLMLPGLALSDAQALRELLSQAAGGDKNG